MIRMWHYFIHDNLLVSQNLHMLCLQNLKIVIVVVCCEDRIQRDMAKIENILLSLKYHVIFAMKRFLM